MNTRDLRSIEERVSEAHDLLRKAEAAVAEGLRCWADGVAAVLGIEQGAVIEWGSTLHGGGATKSGAVLEWDAEVYDDGELRLSLSLLQHGPTPRVRKVTWLYGVTPSWPGAESWDVAKDVRVVRRPRTRTRFTFTGDALPDAKPIPAWTVLALVGAMANTTRTVEENGWVAEATVNINGTEWCVAADCAWMADLGTDWQVFRDGTTTDNFTVQP